MKRFIFSYILLFFHSVLSAQPVDGRLDLSLNEFEKPIALDGAWEFYWMKLLEPGNLPLEDHAVYQFPALWNGGIYQGKEMSAQGFATYRLELILDSTKTYTLAIEDVYSAFTLYWNGKLIGTNGVVATSKAQYFPEWKPLYIPLGNVKKTNEIVLQIANFDHSKGGALEGIQLGLTDQMNAQQLKTVVYDAILTGCLIMGGLFFLGLFFFGRHEKAKLYFSFFCLVYSYRIIGFGYYLLHHLFSISWYVAIRLEYLTLFLSVLLFGKFVEHLYPQEAPKRFWKSATLISIAFCIAVLVSPPLFFTNLVEPFFLIIIVYVLITSVIFVKAYKRNRPGAFFALISASIIFIVFLYNIFVYFGWFSELESASFIGYLAFFFSQSLILSFRFAYFLKMAKVSAEMASNAKSEFLSTISHEIRTPLNAVVGISHLMLDDNPREDQKENLSALKFSAQQLTQLINDILDYNKLEAGAVEFDYQETNLSELLQHLKTSYQVKAEVKGLEFELKCDFEGYEIIVDKTRLGQILGNLLDNAIKFTLDGSVVLAVNKQSESDKQVTLVFEVTDSGIGIHEDLQELVFERFTQASSSTTREYGGSGLGLSIIKRLLELQGIEIQLKSQLGKGSTFYFEQTFEKGKKIIAHEDEMHEELDNQKLVNKRVLLVEDNPMNVLVVKKFLSRWQMHMELAENGEEAVSKAMNGHYDIILMDLQMPVMDGYEATKSIRQNGVMTPIIALTASALFRVRERVLESGMNDYVTKPFEPNNLYQTLAKYIVAP